MVNIIITLDVHCCHMGTAVKHPVSERVKPYVICDFWHPDTLTPGC